MNLEMLKIVTEEKGMSGWPGRPSDTFSAIKCGLQTGDFCWLERESDKMAGPYRGGMRDRDDFSRLCAAEVSANLAVIRAIIDDTEEAWNDAASSISGQLYFRDSWERNSSKKGYQMTSSDWRNYNPEAAAAVKDDYTRRVWQRVSLCLAEAEKARIWQENLGNRWKRRPLDEMEEK